MRPVLDIRKLSVTYPNWRTAVSNIDLAVLPGECVALVGASGSGKTTIGRAVLGLLPADTVVSGSVVVDGTEVVGLRGKEHRSLRGLTVGYVPQDPHAGCDPLRRVRHHVAEAWRAHRMRPPPGRIVELLDSLGISEAERRTRLRPHQWSGGMLQRAAIAAAIAHDPPLTIADEPTSALDRELADKIIALVRGRSRSLLLISHDLSLVAGHAERIAVCVDGRIVEAGRASDVITHPQHEFTREMLAAVPPSIHEVAG